jgi:hypothetical protein
MNRNTALTILSAIVLMVSLSTQANSVKTNSNGPYGFSSGLTLYSPLNKTYNSSLLKLNLTFESRVAGLQGFLNYSIDGKYQGPIPLTFNSFGLGYGLVQLPEFSNGPHVLIVNVGFYNDSHYTGSYVHTIYFAINTSRVITNPTTTSQSPTPSIPEFPPISAIVFPIISAVAVILVLRRQLINKQSFLQVIFYLKSGYTSKCLFTALFRI